MNQNEILVRSPDPDIATAGYIIRQQRRLLPLTLILNCCMLFYTVSTIDFILSINIINWMIATFIVFYSRKKIKEEITEAIRVNKLGKSMDWSALVYYGWSYYFAILIFYYWFGVLIWLMGFAPDGTVYELYGVDPPQTLTNEKK